MAEIQENENVLDEDMESGDDEEKDMDSEESDGSDIDDLALELIAQLEQKIKENPYMYDNHSELIKQLKTAGELEKLRKSRENMSRLFPLTPGIWLDWIKDEIKLMSCDEDRQKITELFARAVKDYQTVPLWLEYVQFAIGDMQGEGGLTKMRKTFEEAITSVGLHVNQGCMIWEVYRETENAVLAGLMPIPGSVVTPEQEELFNVQHQRVHSLFKRQLAVPLLDMGETYSEYKEWLCDEVDHNTQEIYNKALEIVDKFKPLENALSASEAPHWDEYQRYIEEEFKVDDPSRIQCIFERAIADNCLNTDIWIQYTKYLDSKLKIKSVILPVYERSIKNCPWSCQLWQKYLLALERYGESGEKIQGVTAKALTSGFTQADEYSIIWTAYCDYLRRQINWSEDHEEQLSLFRETIEKALDNLYEYFGNAGDANSAMKQYWAFIEAKMCSNMTKAREIWNNIMTEGYGNQANMWLEYYKLERAYGDNKHCRKLLQKAVNSVTDWPESITQAYINFEREEGNLEEYDVAINRCEAQLGRINERTAKAAEKEEFVDQKKPMRNDKKIQKKFDKSKDKIKKEVSPVSTVNNTKQSANKRKLDEPVENTQRSNPKKDNFRVPPPPGYKGEPPPKKVKTEPVIEPVKHDPSKDERTVFISNLLFNVDEDKIREIFCSCGEITEIRLVKNFKGKSKGYAYVEFIDQLPVPKALELDRQLVNNRPMFVSKCEDRGGVGKTKADFRYSNTMEKNKLFIKNLPFTCTKEELSTIFSQHGKLKDVRMITYRSGAPKGLAYIEYEIQDEAAQAILKTDGLKMGEHAIEVAISNPPERKAPVNQRTEFTPHLGGGKKETELRGKARTQIALLPRSVQKTPVTHSTRNEPSSSSSSSQSSGPTSSNGAGGDATIPSNNLSNADFRSMLLKK